MSSLFKSYNDLKDPAVKYNFIEREFGSWKSPSIPMSLRKLLQVQLSNQTRVTDRPLGDDRSRHIKALMAGTVGAGFTLLARVIRISTKTIFLLPAIIVRSSTASRYGLDGAIAELWTRYKEEFYDLKITFFMIPIGILKAWNPSAQSEVIEKIAQNYLKRADRIAEFNKRWEESKQKYQNQVSAAALVRTRTQEAAS